MTADDLFKKMMRDEKVRARHPISNQLRVVTLTSIGPNISRGFDSKFITFQFENKECEALK